MKLKGFKITKRYDKDEPQMCEYLGCPEDLNGLYHYWIKPFRGFCFDIWLCSKHAEIFENKLKAITQNEEGAKA